VNSLLLKTYLKNFVKLNVPKVTGFPEFPNTVDAGGVVGREEQRSHGTGLNQGAR
jgi:hypothetical protein